MTTMKDKRLGALYGAIIGDAVGVPYEFKKPSNIPQYEQIDMVPPDGYKRSWSNIEVGTYSDDSGQLLCVAKCMMEQLYSAGDLFSMLRLWFTQGYMSVDGVTYDAGYQTAAALQSSVADIATTLNEERFNGNGALMRTLPIALAFDNPKEIAIVAREMSRATHPHIRSQLCCAIYCLVAHYMFVGWDVSSAVSRAFSEIRSLYRECPNEIDVIAQYENNEHTGSGYVVDSLWSALSAVWRSSSYDDAIKKSIQYGNDTDTTACIAGGLAGIQYGYEGIPSRWIELLRGKDIILPIADWV